MGIIIQLNQHVANQIAAGEVIERPASVVKELLENSLDAQAKKIDIRIKNAGFEHIIVQDDGVGMDEQDLALSLSRYATSKLNSFSDLYRLNSFGFRGEAIPSMAAVSRLSIISRQSEQDFGIKLTAESGEIKEITKAAASKGTRVLVRDLFYNVPARLKFARSKGIEISEIEKLVKAIAFIEEDVAFFLYADEKLLFSCERNQTDSLIERGHILLGPNSLGHLYDFTSTTDAITVRGILGDPTVSRRDSRGIITFVNKRLVVDKKLIMAIKTAYNTILQVGYQPICALNITVAPDEIDINIHPRKMEVKFKNEQRVIKDIIISINDFLKKTPWLALDVKASSPKISWASDSSYSYHHPLILKNDELLVFSPKPVSQPSQIKLLQAKNFTDLIIVGQIASTYIVLESLDAMVIIDQHAAHERIMFEKIKANQDYGISSSLLIPLPVVLSLPEMALLKTHASYLKELGIEIDIFGENQVVVRSLPNYLHKAHIDVFIKDMLSDIDKEGDFKTHKSFFEQVCATLACHASIRAGQRLKYPEIEALLLELDSTDFAAHCPHGRPIVKSILKSEVKKWFDRT